MSQYNTTTAEAAYKRAIKHVQREIRLERILATFSRRHRRILAILESEEAAFKRRMSQLGEGAKARRNA